MSEDSKPVTVEKNAAGLSHTRMLFVTAGLVVIGSVVGFVYFAPRFGWGFLLGGILSLINYYWLKRSLKKFFDKIVEGEKPRFLAARYFWRYFALGAILGIVYLTEIVPLTAVLLGLAAFAFAIVIEGFILLFSSFFKKKEI